MRPSYLEYLLFPCQLLGASEKPEPPCHQLIFDPRRNGTDVGAVRDDVLLDRGSENDVTEEMDFEGTRPPSWVYHTTPALRTSDGRPRSPPVAAVWVFPI